MTEVGTCCGFNLVSRTESEIKNAVAFNASQHLYVKYPGFENGLTVELDPHIKEAGLTLQSNVAFRIYISDPLLFGIDSLQSFPIAINREIFYSVMPRMITGDESMKDVGPSVRGCYFVNEQDLVMSK